VAGVTPGAATAPEEAAEEPTVLVTDPFPHAHAIKPVPASKTVAPAVPPPFTGGKLGPAAVRHVLDIKSTARVLQLTPTTK